MTSIDPIPVGPFRSTLESRWASYLDDEGLRWKYEAFTIPLGSNRTYTPDFVVEVPTWKAASIGILIGSPHATVVVELKPTVQQAEADHRLERAAELMDNLCLMVIPRGFDWEAMTVPGEQVWRSREQSFQLFVQRVMG